MWKNKILPLFFGKAFLTIFIVINVLNISGQTYVDDPELITTPSGLKYKITKPGSGDFAKPGDRVWVHYYAKFTNDSIYESSSETGPIDAYLGQGQLTKGWEEGLQLVRPGGTILLVVPPELAYGSKPHKNIPANSTLIFEIALLQVNKGTPIQPFQTEGKPLLKGKKGLKYYIIEQGEGELAKQGDNAYVHYTGFLPEGTIFDSSRKRGEAVRITVGIKQVIEGWDIGLNYMRKGSKLRLLIPSKLAYGKQGHNNVVPPNSNIILDVEMVDLIPPEPVVLWDRSGKSIIETPSGLKYVVFETGTGDLIKNDDIVEVHYSGYFTDGELFDSSVKRYEPIKIPVGIGAVIEAWDEGLKLMRKGAKFQLIVPSYLGYGEEGAPPQIPPDADLIFDIEIVDVLK